MPNLIATVKGCATHEQDTFDRVLAARNVAAAAPTAQSESALGMALGRLLALA